MNGIKRDPRESPHPFHHARTQWKAIYEPRRGLSPDIQSASTWILDCPTSRTVWNKFLLFLSDSVYGILLEQLALTKRASILTSDPFVMWAGWDWSSFVLSCHHLQGPRWPFSLPAPGFTVLSQENTFSCDDDNCITPCPQMDFLLPHLIVQGEYALLVGGFPSGSESGLNAFLSCGSVSLWGHGVHCIQSDNGQKRKWGRHI